MSKHWTPRKTKVELKSAPPKPSRIRREPVPEEKPSSLDKVLWRPSREWEIGLALIGMLLFGLAIDALTIGLSAITG